MQVESRDPLNPYAVTTDQAGSDGEARKLAKKFAMTRLRTSAIAYRLRKRCGLERVHAVQIAREAVVQRANRNRVFGILGVCLGLFLFLLDVLVPSSQGGSIAFGGIALIAVGFWKHRDGRKRLFGELEADNETPR